MRTSNPHNQCKCRTRCKRHQQCRSSPWCQRSETQELHIFASPSTSCNHLLESAWADYKVSWSAITNRPIDVSAGIVGRKLIAGQNLPTDQQPELLRTQPRNCPLVTPLLLLSSKGKSAVSVGFGVKPNRSNASTNGSVGLGSGGTIARASPVAKAKRGMKNRILP